MFVLTVLLDAPMFIVCCCPQLRNIHLMKHLLEAVNIVMTRRKIKKRCRKRESDRERERERENREWNIQ